MGSRKQLNRRTNGELSVNRHPGIKVYYQWYFKNLIEGVHVMSLGGNFLHISAYVHMCTAILIGSE